LKQFDIVGHVGRFEFRRAGLAGADASRAVPLEATAEDKFQIEGLAVFTFDAEKNQMTVKRRNGEGILTKEK
jgi:hypothetical protein